MLIYVTLRSCVNFLDQETVHYLRCYWPTWILNNTVRNQTKIPQDTVEFYGAGQFYRTVLRGAWTQLHKNWRRHRAIMATQEIYFRVWISYCIFKHRQLKVEWFASGVENNAKFRTFWPLVKIGVGVGEITIPIVEALPTTEPQQYIYQSTARLLSEVDW